MPPAKIFLSYRRQDMLAAGVVGRIHEKLATHFGDHNVFTDVDSIPPGKDFRQILDEAVGKADVFLTVMGPQWLSLLRERSKDASDFVRVEIESALRREIAVVPLLIGNVKMPTEGDLPEQIKALAYCNAFQLDPGRDFGAHIGRLIADLERHYAVDRARTRSVLVTWLTALVLTVVLLLVGYLLFSKDDQSPSTESTPPVPFVEDRDRIVAEFSQLNLIDKPGYTVAAAPHLNRFGISVREISPPESSLAIVNNLGLYNGAAIRPQGSENFLTQFHTGNVAGAYFVLQFEKPLREFTFVRPALYPATETGVTHPAWKAEASDRSGEILSSQSEGLTRAFEDVREGLYTMRAPGLTGIKQVRFESDPQLDGKPFAGFGALLIERLELVPMKEVP